MAYTSVAQTEHETIYNDGNNALQAPFPTSPTSPVLTELSHRPLSLTFEEISGAVAVVDPTAKDINNGSEGVGNMLKSLSTSSHSYEMVEDDEFEDMVATPRRLHFNKTSQPHHPDSNEVNTQTTSEQTPARTASVSRHLPLKHPTPDLQALQGGYVKNVERLEESAERLSITSSLDDELPRKRGVERITSAASSKASRKGLPSRQFSTSSFSNSIVGVNNAARNGGYSSSGYNIASPTGSVRSGSWTQNGPVHRRTSKASRLATDPQALELERKLPGRGADMAPHHGLHETEDELDDKRPMTSASNGSHSRRNDPFADFDGSHYNNRPSMDRASLRRISLQHPPLARDSKAYKEAQPGETMIYYPAPVPVMLNLPTRLSRMNLGDREKRRLQALSGIPDEMRKSAAWLSSENANPAEKQKSAALPPQLRASAFFDQPSNAPAVQLKNGSAVQTLDSILDAAAHAPVSAFTDHPIAGRLGKEVYGLEKSPRKSVQLDKDTKKKRMSSRSNILKIRKSQGELDGKGPGRITSRESKALDQEDALSGDELERNTAHSIAPGEDELATPTGENEDDSDTESSDSEHRPGFSGAPTTLLAELQMRKAAQKQRNRTAADAFPNGMHSTLLELDAVRQLQQKSRKTKHVTLAWEDHEAAERENFDDEDVPLGVLYPEKDRVTHQNINRPMGLMEKKEMEDNEPLSHRRARLRGEPLEPVRAESFVAEPNKPDDDASKYKIDLPGIELDEPEEETLGQRIKRMKEQKEKTTAAGFASDVASQLGLDTEDKPAGASKTPDIEETLGQRRQRLKEEAAKAEPKLKTQRSLADVLQAHPVGPRQVSNESHNSRPGLLPRHHTFGQTNLSTPQLPPHIATLPYYHRSPYMNPAGNASAYAFNGGVFAMNGYYGGLPPLMQDPMMGPPLDPQQRAVIDRWRESIL